MLTSDIIEYIQTKYPKVLFKPFKLQYKSALAFVITDNKIIIGYINKSGGLCKVLEPINLNNFNISDLSKIPTVDGFSENDKENLIKLFDSSNGITKIDKAEHEAIIKSLQLNEQAKIDEYKVLYDNNTQQTITIKSKYEDEIKNLKQQFQQSQEDFEKSKQKLIDEKETILLDIAQYKEQVKEYLNSKDIKIDELTRIYNNLQTDKEKLQEQLNLILESEQTKLQELEQTNSSFIKEKEDFIAKLSDSVESITAELENVKVELSKSKLKEEILQRSNKECTERVLQDKDMIISKIREYNEKWLNWAGRVKTNVGEWKASIIREARLIESQLDRLIAQSQLNKKEREQLNRNIRDIQIEMRKTISSQIAELNSKDEQIRLLQSSGSGFVIDETLNQKNEEIEKLKQELQQVRDLLLQNGSAQISKEIDYTECNNILQNFFALNNIFYRRLEIIKRLDNIIEGNKIQLDNDLQERIKTNYAQVKTEILNHIRFLDLDKYINSQNFQYLKSKTTQNKVPKEFCNELTNILEYWNTNLSSYRQQENMLTNIYEDLSGAVRVYIRIKPLIGSENESKTILLNPRQKQVNLRCTSPNNQMDTSFGEFYGVFDETFTNENVFTGISSSSGNLKIDNLELINSSDSISPGLYNVFKQVEDGYSIVLFGYGASGSGKSFSLLGSRGTPGLLHYGLSNLENIETIKLKYLFEQYMSAVDINFATVRGKIHNLIREVPQMRQYSKNESVEFSKTIPFGMNLDNIKVNDLYILTDVIDKYRQSMGRIKRTPNNPVSSRSHLYFVFEVKFSTGKTGYVTIVDTAGRESPIDIFNTFIDTTKTTLSSLMAPKPVGGEPLVEKYKKTDLESDYTASHIMNVLREGFYINETINHLVYYFNKKNWRQTKILLQSQDATKYLVDRYYVNPIKEETIINTGNNSLTIPIMNFLDNLSSRQTYKPTKFIMLCNVRQEEKYCKQTAETLAFAQTIAST